MSGMSGKRTGFILSILCVVGLFLLVPMYLEAQKQQTMTPILFSGEGLPPSREDPLEAFEILEPANHSDVLLGAILVVGILVIAFPLIGFWYDERTKDVMINVQKQDVTTSSGSTNSKRLIISFIIALLPVIAWLIVVFIINMNFPAANPSGLQRLEELTLRIVVSVLLFVPTFRGVYSFLNKTR